MNFTLLKFLIDYDFLIYFKNSLNLLDDCINNHLKCSINVNNLGVIYGVTDCLYCNRINNLLIDFSSFKTLTKYTSNPNISILIFLNDYWYIVLKNNISLFEKKISFLLPKYQIHYFEKNNYLFSFDSLNNTFLVNDIIHQKYSKKISKNLKIKSIKNNIGLQCLYV